MWLYMRIPTTHIRQKLAAYNSFVHRLLSVPLDANDFNDELNTIKHIAAASGYECRMVDNILRKHKAKKFKQLNNLI